MKMRKLGHAGPEVSEIGFGCMGISFSYGQRMERADAIALLRGAVERGVNSP